MTSLTKCKKSLALLSIPLSRETIIIKDDSLRKLVSIDKTNINILHLQGCEVAAVDLAKDECLKFFCNLETLDVSFCALNEVPKQYFQFSRLTELNLSNNLLSEVPDGIKILSRLNTLDLSSNKLEFLPYSMGKLELKYLNISHNKFVNMPGVFYHGLKKMEIVDASNNSIHDIEHMPICFETLVSLNLSKNDLSKIPTWIFHNKCKIEELLVNGNKLTKEVKVIISTNIESINVTNLTRLELQNCNLISENLSFLSHLKNLKVLNIGNGNVKGPMNFLTDLNFDIFMNCMELSNLVMQNVQLSVLSDNFGMISRIKILDLSKNNIVWLPDSICVLERLRTCILSRNRLLFLPKEFKKLKSLRVLRLDHNHLEHFPIAVKDLPALEFLDLYDNKFDFVPRDVLEIGLKRADLSWNYLGDLGEEWEGLKEGYRVWLGQQEEGVMRCDGQKRVDEDEDFVGGVWNGPLLSSEEFVEEEEEEEEEREVNTEVVTEADSPEESWELDLTEHGHEVRGPFRDGSQSLYLIRMEALRALQRTRFRRDRFCPADWHPPSPVSDYVRMKILLNEPEEAEEGQFDSASSDRMTGNTQSAVKYSTEQIEALHPLLTNILFLTCVRSVVNDLNTLTFW